MFPFIVMERYFGILLCYLQAGFHVLTFIICFVRKYIYTVHYGRVSILRTVQGTIHLLS